jgi:phospholipid/cholesterol/gamma-HCH transport system permease protein
MHFALERQAGQITLRLRGAWRVTELPQIAGELAAVELAGARAVRIATQELESLDLSGAWQLREFLEQARAGGAHVSFEGPEPDQLRLIEVTLRGEAHVSPAPETPAWSELQPVAALGRRVLRHAWGALAAFAFLGRVSAMGVTAGASPKRLRPISIARHVFETGLTAIPIASLIAFLISVIVAYISAQQLQQFGAEVFVVDLIAIAVLREMGVLLTAIIVAGRSGSAFAAEIGAMKLNEEVDALRATGVEPYEVLILPRVIGLVIALPLLTVVADAVGLTGGALLCYALLDMPITQYLARLQDAIAPTTFWVGIIKAPVFALLIALAGTYRGMQVRTSSRELGRMTTVAVVQSIFLVILADALFAVLFMELDI